ncbi:MAG: hypothetical protein JW829_15315 [Pirellulales bacterium]|nr:hypothetical protein [Pirellulales bacterium]
MHRIALSLIVGLAGLSPLWSQEPVIWVASPWQHVLRSSEPGEAESAEIVAGRNEYEPLRVIIRAGVEALANVRVEASALTGPEGRIDASNITLFREHYINIDKPSHASNAPTGWYPDALIPILGDIWPKWTPEDGIDDSHSGERLRRMVQDRHVNSLCVPFAYRTEPEKCRDYLRDMAAYLRSKGWLDLAYIYMEDEPNNAEQYEIVRQQGELIRESGIKRLCTEQTIPF